MLVLYIHFTQLKFYLIKLLRDLRSDDIHKWSHLGSIWLPALQLHMS